MANRPAYSACHSARYSACHSARALVDRAARLHRIVLGAAALLVALSWGSTAEAQIAGPDDLCTGDPCIIGNRVLDQSLTADFGDRLVFVLGTLDMGSHDLTILARGFALLNQGQIIGVADVGPTGGVLEIDVTEDIALESTVSTGGIQLSNGCDGGLLTLTANDGEIRGAAHINLDRITAGSCNADGSGGEAVFFAGEHVDLTGELLATGASQACGGSLEVFAGGDLRMESIDVTGGDCDGGSVIIDAFGSVMLGELTADGGGESGIGGEISIASGGAVTVTGSIQAFGASHIAFGGDGGTLEIDAGFFGPEPADVRIGDILTLNGRGPDGCGGTLTIDGREVDLDAELRVRGQADLSCGGEIDITASRRITVKEDIKADSGSFGGPFITLVSDQVVEVLALINANARGAGGVAGDIVIEGQLITIADEVRANAGSFAPDAGTLLVSGCHVTMLPGGKLLATGAAGSIQVEASGRMLLDGPVKVNGQTGSINLLYRDPDAPPDVAGANFQGTPMVSLTPGLPACNLAACVDEQDNDGDGLIDFPDDPDCGDMLDLSEEPECRDGLDNDLDGLLDYPADIGCETPDSRNESPQCSDGIDNDDDGQIDWDGAGIADPDEFCEGKPYKSRESKKKCGLGFELALLLPLWSVLRRRRRGA